MLQAFSQTEKALRDTSLRYSDDESFDWLANGYGWPRPPAISIKNWRAALRVALWGARGVFHTLNAFLREVLMDYSVTVDDVYQSNSPEDNLFYLPDIVPGNDLSPRPLRRWNLNSISLDEVLQHQLTGRDIYATLPNGERVTCRIVREQSLKGGWRWAYLPMVTTAYWTAPPDTETMSDAANPTFTAKVLPFTLEEPNPHPGRNLRGMQAAEAAVGQIPNPFFKKTHLKLWESKTAKDFSDAHNTVILRLFTAMTELFNFKFTYWQHTGTEGYTDNQMKKFGIQFSDPDTGFPLAARPDNQIMGGHVQTDEGYIGDPNGPGPFPPYFVDDGFISSSQSLLWQAIKKLMPDGCHLIIEQAYPLHEKPTMGKTPELTNPAVGGIPGGWQP